MTDTKSTFEIFRCPSCNKPTTESLDVCRHCHAKLRGIAAGKKVNRFFADEGHQGKLSCLLTTVLLIVSGSMMLAVCNHASNERDRAEARKQADLAKEEEDRYQDRVRLGTVCSDGPNGAVSALELNVKRRLKDPDSFVHMGTVVLPAKDGNGYDALMRFRSKNSFGGYSVGTAVARLYLAARYVCEVRDFEVQG